jgi:hypothetical protein
MLFDDVFASRAPGKFSVSPIQSESRLTRVHAAGGILHPVQRSKSRILSDVQLQPTPFPKGKMQ